MTARAGRLGALLLGLGLLLAPSAGARDGDAMGMTRLGRLFQGIPHRIALRDPYAYVALDSGLQILDVSNAAAPLVVGHLYLDSEALDVDLDGAFAYVAGGESGLAVIDVADPASPALVARFPTSGTRAVAVASGIAYLAEASDAAAAVYGLRLVDVSTPAAPQARGFLPLSNGALDVAVSGSIALVGLGSELGGAAGVVAVDVASPAAPLVRGFLATGKPVNQVTIAGSLAYLAMGVAATGTFAVVDFGPATPVALASVPLFDGALGVSLPPGGGVAYVAARALGVLAYDVSNPASPSRLSGFPTQRETSAVAARGDVVFLGERASTRRASFTAVNSTPPSAPSELASLAYAEATATAVEGGRAYLLERDGLHVFDASDPTALAPLFAWAPGGADFSSLDVAGNVAAVADGEVVHLLDVTAAPAPIGDAVLDGVVAVRVVIDPPYLYVVDGRGLEVFDLAAPGAPIGVLDLAAGRSSALAVDGVTGYLTAGDTLHAVNLSVPATPTVIGSLTFPGEELYGVAVDPVTRMAVLTGPGSYYHQVDVTDPTAPVADGSLADPAASGRDVVLLGDRAVIAAASGGIRVVQVKRGVPPALEASYDTSGTAVALSGEGDTLFLASLAAQHWVLRCDTCVTCAPAATITPNSLAAVKRPVDHVLSWRYTGPAGDANVHRTEVKAELTALHADLTKLVATTSGQPVKDSVTLTYTPPPGLPGLYRVFARDCLGNSVAP